MTRKINDLLLVFVISFLCVITLSCGSKKETSRVVVDSDIKRNMDMSLDSFMNERVSWLKTNNTLVDIVIREKVFDSDKPVDPSTGERPVVSTKDTNISFSGSDSLVINKESDKGYKKNVSEDLVEKVDIDLKKEVSKKESSWPIAVIFVSSLVILLLFVYLLKRFGVIR